MNTRAKSVAVYNLGGEQFLHHVSLQKALKNIINGKYRTLKSDANQSIGDYMVPTMVELTRYKYTKWKYEQKGEIPFSKRGVLRRDKYTCCYCGGLADTVDHVLPKWQGNAASWNNSVAACFPCNNKKGGHSPEEAGMPMLFRPVMPDFRNAFKWTKGGVTSDDPPRR